MSNDHILREYTYTDENGVTQTLSAYEAQVGTRGGASGRIWYTCQQCRYHFPEDDITLISGVPYCIPNGCYTEHEEVV